MSISESEDGWRPGVWFRDLLGVGRDLMNSRGWLWGSRHGARECEEEDRPNLFKCTKSRVICGNPHQMQLDNEEQAD